MKRRTHAESNCHNSEVLMNIDGKVITEAVDADL